MPLMPPNPEKVVTWPKNRFAMTPNVRVIMRK